MPLKEYCNTADDEWHAMFYLSGRLRNHGLEFRDSASSADAENEYRIAANEPTRNQRAAALNAWCERYLSKADMRKLKTAVRKRRERWRRTEAMKTVTISAKAHKLLTQLSERDTVTFSRVLEHYLAKAVNSTRGRFGLGKIR